MGTMLNWDEEWSISFAGCGFRSVYYLGALSCILQQVPQLVHGASTFGGASSGCLVAAALAVGFPIELFCAEVLTMAKNARRHILGVFHPNFSLLQEVQKILVKTLPADAHVRATGRLCVSLTRMADGKNVLVSEFASREELIQVLMCSCFFPVYCGFSPPSYRGVRYMDGALSNNMPLFQHRNTITMAPFSSGSDICPREGAFSFLEVHHGNINIHISTHNVHRIWTAFLPPTLDKLAEICHEGYLDALRFLRDRDLLGKHPSSSLTAQLDVARPSCELVESQKTMLNGQNCRHGDHPWLDAEVMGNLPVSFKKVLREACRDARDDGSILPPLKVAEHLRTLLVQPVQMTVLLIRSLVASASTAIWRLWTSATDLRRGTSDGECENLNSSQSRTGKDVSPLTSNSNKNLHWDNNGNLDPFDGKTPLNYRHKSTLHSE
ncbi:uncharacterized protein V6R79_011309 [Siganus canaliculatus]